MNKTVVLIKDTAAAGDATRDMQALWTAKLRDAGLEGAVQVARAADLGVYGSGATVVILPGNYRYANVQPSDIDRIIDTTIKQGKATDGLARGGVEQVRIVLRNCGRIDPESIDDYFSVKGFQGLGRCLFDLTPEQVIEEIKIRAYAAGAGRAIRRG